MGAEAPLATATGHEDSRRWQLGSDVLACRYDGGTALLSLATGKYYTLNETASAMWEHLTGALTIDEAARSIAANCEIGLDIAQRDVGELLATLSRLRLILPRVNRRHLTPRSMVIPRHVRSPETFKCCAGSAPGMESSMAWPSTAYESATHVHALR